jgi:hypothetical protein
MQPVVKEIFPLLFVCMHRTIFVTG